MSTTIMQSLTFIIFIVFEKIATLTFLLQTDNRQAVRPTLSLHRLALFTWVKNKPRLMYTSGIKLDFWPIWPPQRFPWLSLDRAIIYLTLVDGDANDRAYGINKHLLQTVPTRPGVRYKSERSVHKKQLITKIDSTNHVRTKYGSTNHNKMTNQRHQHCKSRTRETTSNIIPNLPIKLMERRLLAPVICLLRNPLTFFERHSEVWWFHSIYVRRDLAILGKRFC